MSFLSAQLPLQQVTDLGNSTTNALRVLSNSNGLALGTTGQSTVSYNGTDLVLEPQVSGSGVVALGATYNRDLRLNKIGLGGSAISANFFINFSGSGSNRGAMSFDFTSTGTNPLVDLFLKATCQNTNAAPNAGCLAAQKIKDCNQTGTGTFYGVSASIGTLNTRTITQGTSHMIGVDINANQGTGTANSGGTVRDYGIRISSFPGYTGVATYEKWGINSQEDIQLTNNVYLCLGGTLTSKGTNRIRWNNSASTIETDVGGTTQHSLAANLLTFKDAFDIAVGTGTGTKIGTTTSQKLGFFNATPVTQRANIVAITDSSGGTVGNTINAIGIAVADDNLATMVDRINKIEQLLQDLGLTA